jgi:hypothetical protein
VNVLMYWLYRLLHRDCVIALDNRFSINNGHIGVAFTNGMNDTVHFFVIPKSIRDAVIDEMEVVLEHEYIHLAIDKVQNHFISAKFDNLFGEVEKYKRVFDLSDSGDAK